MVGPYFVDWTAHRADFEREASRILGRSVEVRGTASARILPFPSVTFTDVIVAGAPGEAPLLTIDRFGMDAELAPYLSGEIRIFSMRLDRPRLRVPVNRDGTVALVGADSALPAGATVVLEEVEIVDGSVTVENGLTARTHAVSGIAATLSARSLAGPFAGSGALDAGGERIDFVLSSGPMAPGSGLPLKLTLTAPSLDASLVLDGSARVADAKPGFEGSLRLTSPLPKPTPTASENPGLPARISGMKDTGQPGEGEGEGNRRAPTVALLPPIDLAGKVLATPSSIEVTDARLAAGGGEAPYILTGSGSLGLSRLPHFTLALAGEQVDVDGIVGEDALGGAPADAVRPAVTFEQRLEAARAVFAAVPRPSIPGTVSIALPVVVAGDTTIRDVAFTVSPTDTGWSVERFRAEMPGRTRMEATGVVRLDDAFSFSGDLLVASRQPSGFSDWLTGAVDPAVRALPQAGFSAEVTLTKERQAFRDLEIDVGGEMLKGSLERSGPSDARAMTAELSAGRVDLDALLALSRLFTGTDDSIADADRLALKIGAGPVSYGGAVAERVDADLSYDGSRLAIATLAIDDLAGADLTMSGDLGGFGGDVSGRLSVALDAASPAEPIAFLAARLPPSPAMNVLARRGPRLGPLTLRGEIATVEEAPGEKPTLQADISGTAAGTDVVLKLALGNGIYAKGESGRFGLDLTLSNAVPAVLIGQLGLDALSVGTPAPLTAQIQMSAGAAGPVVASAAIRAPDSEITADGTFDVTATGVTAAEFGLTAKSRDAAPWAIATGTGLGLPPTDALPVDMSASLVFADGDLSLDGLAGTIGTTYVSGTLSRHAGGPVAGELALSELSLPWLAALVYGRSPGSPDTNAGTTAETGPGWSKESFGLSLLPPVEASLDIDVARLSLGGGQAAADVVARMALKPDGVEIEDLKGSLGGGFVSAAGALRNAGGVGQASMRVSFSGLDLGALALSAEGGGEAPATGPGEPAVAGTLDAALSLDASGQSYQGLISAMTGAGRLTVSGASFSGLRQGLFPDILRAADAEGFEPDTASATSLLDTLTAGARYAVPRAAADISVLAGVARTTPATIASPGETLTVEASLDLETREVSGTLRLDLDPGDEAVEGVSPSILATLSGPLAGPSLSPDVQALASYLSVRAYEREQARVEAMQEQLQERLRLRREARLLRWREEKRIAAEVQAAEIERQRLDRQREEEARREAEAAERTRAEAEAARRAEEDRLAEVARRVEEARRAEAARQADERRRAEESRKAEERRAEERRAEEARWAEEVRRALDRQRLTPPAEPQGAPRPANAAPKATPEVDSRRSSASPSGSSGLPPLPPPRDLENPVTSPPPRSLPDFEALPGVNNPLDF